MVTTNGRTLGLVRTRAINSSKGSAVPRNAGTTAVISDNGAAVDIRRTRVVNSGSRADKVPRPTKQTFSTSRIGTVTITPYLELLYTI